jgi:Fe-Mn family superoxide dismutase
MEHKLPELPYDPASLEPFIDAQTMIIHHTKHHQAYTNKFNEALEKYPELFNKNPEELIANLNSIPEDIRTAVKNHGGGYVNHCFFWEILSPSRQAPSDSFLRAINSSFNSFDEFKTRFSNAALTKFGSGWVWLVLNENKQLEITSTANQDSPLSEGKIPILTLDIWEHAYYLKYQNRRIDYISAFWSVVNWKKVEELYQKVMGD